MRPAGKTTRLRGIEASIEATLKLESAHNARRALCTKQLEQAEYEARRAFEQYDQVDARNRLVATELEAHWSLSFSTLSMRPGRGLRSASYQQARSHDLTIPIIGASASMAWASPTTASGATTRSSSRWATWGSRSSSRIAAATASRRRGPS